MLSRHVGFFIPVLPTGYPFLILHCEFSFSFQRPSWVLMSIPIILWSLQIHLPITTLIFSLAQLWISFRGCVYFLVVKIGEAIWFSILLCLINQKSPFSSSPTCSQFRSLTFIPPFITFLISNISFCSQDCPPVLTSGSCHTALD